MAALSVVAAIVACACAPAEAIPARTSLPVIERQVMCATCKIPLNVAESPQADRERAFIRTLIAQGRTEAQIKNALVVQYGPAVLALPSAARDVGNIGNYALAAGAYSVASVVGMPLAGIVNVGGFSAVGASGTSSSVRSRGPSGPSVT